MSTENVRRAYLRGATTPDAPIATSIAVERSFDRWLAEERRAAAEKAWDELDHWFAAHDATWEGRLPENPYLAREVAPDGR